MTPTDLDPATLQQRYDLLCRALQATPAADDPQPALDAVSRLDDLIHRELLELARLGSPDDFVDIYLGFARELARFREFCADPRLAEKTVVAFGGPFSAGKSSLINALIGKKLLVVEVDPTTALPAYVLAGEADAVHALNLHRLRITLTEEELASLTHDETQRYGSQVARSLSAAFITRRDFPWANLAFIDTPGYTGRAVAGDRTDADLAAAQLAGAHAIVWVASIKQGNLSEDDLAFLARLDPDIPRIVVASHADQLTDSDRAAVVERMRDTLAARNLPALGVYAVSARPRYAELLTPLRAQLDAWNQTPRQQRFAHRFKALFTRYQRGLEREANVARWQLHRINRIATLADGELVGDASELKTIIDERMDALKTVESRLRDLRGCFFGELKRAGDTVGIPLPEPHEVELLEPGRSNLLERLVALREQEGRKEPDIRLALTRLREDGAATHGPLLTRRLPREPRAILSALCGPGDATHRPLLTRRLPREPLDSLAALRRPGDAAHRPLLLRRPAKHMHRALKLLQD
jgi:GTP-binding protein EngB required for normal cell division